MSQETETNQGPDSGMDPLAPTNPITPPVGLKTRAGLKAAPAPKAAAVGFAPRKAAKKINRGPVWLKPRFLISGSIVALMLLMAAFPQLFAGFGADPNANCDIMNTNQPPSPEHTFGVDIQGCDYYTNVIFGARASILVGIVVTAISFVISALLGSLAGYFGGWVDTIISRACDMAFGLPFILAAIVVLQLFSERTVWTVIFALALFSWAGGVRFMRSSVLEVRNREYVQASRLLGASHGRIIKHPHHPQLAHPAAGAPDAGHRRGDLRRGGPDVHRHRADPALGVLGPAAGRGPRIHFRGPAPADLPGDLPDHHRARLRALWRGAAR